MRFTITRAHLKKAIAQNKIELGTSFVCPVAQSISEKFPNKLIQVGGEKVWVGGSLLSTTPTMRKVVSMFDDKDYNNLRKLLPLSFVLKGV